MIACPHCIALLILAAPVMAFTGAIGVNTWHSWKWRRRDAERYEAIRAMGGTPLCPEEPQVERPS